MFGRPAPGCLSLVVGFGRCLCYAALGGYLLALAEDAGYKTRSAAGMLLPALLGSFLVCWTFFLISRVLNPGVTSEREDPPGPPADPPAPPEILMATFPSDYKGLPQKTTPATPPKNDTAKLIKLMSNGKKTVSKKSK